MFNVIRQFPELQKGNAKTGNIKGWQQAAFSAFLVFQSEKHPLLPGSPSLGSTARSFPENCLDSCHVILGWSSNK